MTDAKVFRGAFRRRWWVPLLLAAAAVAAAGVSTAGQQAVYTTHATLVVTPSSRVSDTTDVLRSLETLERRTIVATFARLAARAETRDRAAEAMGVEAGELRRYRISGSVVPNTNLIRVEVRGPEAETVATLADAAGEVIREEGRRLYRVYSLRTVAAAETPRRPARPDRQRNLVVAAVVGLFIGVLGAVALEAFSTRGSSEGGR